MPRRAKERIFGYVDLTDEFREQVMEWKLEGKNLTGWIVYPAHHRENPTRLILLNKHPDTEGSWCYHFDDPEKRDENFQILSEPLPIHSERDKEFFLEQNSLAKERGEPKRYRILKGRKDYIEAYDPDEDFNVPKSKLSRKRASNIA